MSGWKFEKIYSVSVSGRQLEHDGKFVWVTCSDGVRLYNYWGANSGNEPTWETIDSLTRDQFDETKFTLFKFIPITGGCFWIARAGNKMFVSSAAQFNELRSIDISTWEVSSAIQTPEEINSNICWSADALWMVGIHKTNNVEPDQQKLHRYKNGVWTYTFIPQRKSTVRQWVSAPYNDKIYVTTYNNVAVCKFNATTGAYEGSIRVNAFPTRMLATPERELFVSSFAGMLSTINTTDDSVSNSMSTFDFIAGIAAPPGGQQFWFSNTIGRLTVLNRLDNTAILSAPKPDSLSFMDPDWTLDLEGFGEVGFDELMITPALEYSVWNGTSFDTVQLKPYLFALTQSKLHCIRLDNPLYRDAYFEINGQAAITTGNKQYFGEQG